MNTNLEPVRLFLKKNLSDLHPASRSGPNPVEVQPLFESKPFDLKPRDFLDFAQIEIEKESKSIRRRINAIGHSKRAIECQTDIFLHQLGLLEICLEKNLGLNTKLDFLRDIGVLAPQSLTKLNQVRNKIEHHYKIPEINDVEVYIDLSASFVSGIESEGTNVLHNSLLVMHPYLEERNSIRNFDTSNSFRVKYSRANREISFGWNYKGETGIFAMIFASLKDLTTFSQAMKIFVLLAKFRVTFDQNFVINNL